MHLANEMTANGGRLVRPGTHLILIEQVAMMCRMK
jgi:hypothetical protein